MFSKLFRLKCALSLAYENSPVCRNIRIKYDINAGMTKGINRTLLEYPKDMRDTKALVLASDM